MTCWKVKNAYYCYIYNMHDAYYKIILLLVGICICHAYYMLEYAFSIIYSKKKLCVKKEYKFLSEKELIH